MKARYVRDSYCILFLRSQASEGLTLTIQKSYDETFVSP